MVEILDTKAWTKLVLAASTVGLIGYDVWVAAEPTQGDTISEVINTLGAQWPIIPFAWGALTSHLFSRKNIATQTITGPSRYVYLGLSGVIVLAETWLGLTPDLGAAPWLLAGGVIGWVFWPQFDQNFEK